MAGSAKILVFDADVDSCDHAADLLSLIGYDVDSSASAKEATLRLRQSRIDAVLLDVDTNEILGTEIIREARTRNPECSIILMGSKEALDANPNLLLFGGYEYVLKPLSQEVLRAAVEQRLNQQRIYRICSTLGSTLDLDDTLDLVLDTALRETSADHGVVMLENGVPGVLKIEAARGLPKEILGSEYAIEDRGIIRLVLDNCEPAVMQGGFTQLGFLPDEISSAISSSVCAPIRVDGKSVGVLNINRAAQSRPFSQSDLRLIEIISMQAAAALTNSRAHLQALERQKIDHELDLARSIQQSLLPQTSFRQSWIDVAPQSAPARVIGGDFYDVVELGDNRFGLVVADVAGKGIPGALLMVRAISSFRLRVGPDISPGAVFSMLNKDLILEGSRGMYVTAIYAIFDSRRQTLQFTCAGHPDPILRRSGYPPLAAPRESGAIPLGIMKDTEFETIEVDFRPGDLAVFYTDGVTEARSISNEEFTIERLESLIGEQPSTAKTIVDSVMSELTSFTTGRPMHDDVTIVAVGPHK